MTSWSSTARACSCTRYGGLHTHTSYGGSDAHDDDEEEEEDDDDAHDAAAGPAAAADDDDNGATDGLGDDSNVDGASSATTSAT